MIDVNAISAAKSALSALTRRRGRRGSAKSPESMLVNVVVVLGTGLWLAHGRMVPNGAFVVCAPDQVVSRIPSDLPLHCPGSSVLRCALFQQSRAKGAA